MLTKHYVDWKNSIWHIDSYFLKKLYSCMMITEICLFKRLAEYIVTLYQYLFSNINR